MKVKRFVAASVKAALVLVKERLGADAVILSNRSTPEGVEVLAIAEADMTDMAVAPDAAALAQAEPPPGFTASFKRDTTSKASISPELADFFDAPDTAVNKPSSTATADLRSPLPKLVARSATPESTVVVRTPVVHTPVVHTPIVRPPIVRTPVARTLEPRAVRTPAWSERNHQTRELNAIPPSPNFDGPIAADELPQHFVSRNATVRSFNFAELLNKPFEQEKPVPRSSGAATTARPPVQRAVQNDGLHAAPRGVQPTPPSAGSNRAGLQGGHSAGAMESNVATVASPDMMAELRALRGFIEERLAFAGWSDELRRRPVASTLMRELLAAGFSTALARAATSALPEALDAKEARSWLHQRIADKLSVASGAEDIIERGGVFALTGPTGVGKTTTTAKIAARCVVKYGAASLGLITTDTYRIGAHDQLKVFGKILGVPVHSVHDALGLTTTLDAMKGKRLVLIDTIGLGQRDDRVDELMAMLDSCGVQRLVLLAATAQIETMEEVMAAYGQSHSGVAAAGTIVTKLDEAVKLGAVVDVLVRHKFHVHFVGVGQRVPEDLALPDKNEMVRSALRVTRGGPFSLTKDEAGLLAAFSGSAEPLGHGAAHA